MKNLNLYIYEDEGALDLYPISKTRPIFDIYCGHYTFIERITHYFPNANISLFVRDEMSNIVKENYPNYDVNPIKVKKGIWLLGNLLWSKTDLEYVINSNYKIYKNENKIIAANLNKYESQNWLNEGGPLKSQLSQLDTSSNTNDSLSSPIIKYLWDAIKYNPTQIKLDSQFYNAGQKLPNTSKLTLIEKDKIFIGRNVKLNPYTIFDATNGEIIIEKNVEINSFCCLEGPLFIGKNSEIRPNTQIKGGTTIGPFSKIGGEISQSIFHGNTNKIHYGYIGNSYIGEWVNLGAGTTNSNLKNNYSNIIISVNNSFVNTNSNKIGCFIGDHTKTAIGTYLNTGTVIDIACNIVSVNNYPPKYLPPFTWFINGKEEKYIFEKFLIMVEMIKQKRGLSMSLAEKEMLKKKYDKAVN